MLLFLRFLFRARDSLFCLAQLVVDLFDSFRTVGSALRIFFKHGLLPILKTSELALKAEQRLFAFDVFLCFGDLLFNLGDIPVDFFESLRTFGIFALRIFLKLRLLQCRKSFKLTVKIEQPLAVFGFLFGFGYLLPDLGDISVDLSEDHRIPFCLKLFDLLLQLLQIFLFGFESLLRRNLRFGSLDLRAVEIEAAAGILFRFGYAALQQGGVEPSFHKHLDKSAFRLCHLAVVVREFFDMIVHKPHALRFVKLYRPEEKGVYLRALDLAEYREIVSHHGVEIQTRLTALVQPFAVHAAEYRVKRRLKFCGSARALSRDRVRGVNVRRAVQIGKMSYLESCEIRMKIYFINVENAVSHTPRDHPFFFAYLIFCHSLVYRLLRIPARVLPAAQISRIRIVTYKRRFDFHAEPLKGASAVFRTAVIPDGTQSGGDGFHAPRIHIVGDVRRVLLAGGKLFRKGDLRLGRFKPLESFRIRRLRRLAELLSSGFAVRVGILRMKPYILAVIPGAILFRTLRIFIAHPLSLCFFCGIRFFRIAHGLRLRLDALLLTFGILVAQTVPVHFLYGSLGKVRRTHIRNVRTVLPYVLAELAVLPFVLGSDLIRKRTGLFHLLEPLRRDRGALFFEEETLLLGGGIKAFLGGNASRRLRDFLAQICGFLLRKGLADDALILLLRHRGFARLHVLPLDVSSLGLRGIEKPVLGCSSFCESVKPVARLILGGSALLCTLLAARTLGGSGVRLKLLLIPPVVSVPPRILDGIACIVVSAVKRPDIVRRGFDLIRREDRYLAPASAVHVGIPSVISAFLQPLNLLALVFKLIELGGLIVVIRKVFCGKVDLHNVTAVPFASVSFRILSVLGKEI